MKRLLTIVLCIGIILTFLSFLLIPNQISISKVEEVESNERIISTYLLNSESRQKWWPEKNSSGSGSTDSLAFNGSRYTFHNPRFGSVDITMSGKGITLPGRLTWVNYSNNLIRLSWRTTLPASNNPLTRVSRYLRARKIKSDMTEIMQHCLSFITDRKKVYGYDFKVEQVKDTLLATTSFQSDEFPENSRVYQRISEIQKHIALQGVKATKAPMLNVATSPDGKYLTNLALPIEKRIEENKNILLTRMVPGNILTAEVKGGPNSIAGGFAAMELFMDDFNMSSPAMHYQSLVTDRLSQPDTSKWITKLYYPIY